MLVLVWELAVVPVEELEQELAAVVMVWDLAVVLVPWEEPAVELVED